MFQPIRLGHPRCFISSAQVHRGVRKFLLRLPRAAAVRTGRFYRGATPECVVLYDGHGRYLDSVAVSFIAGLRSDLATRQLSWQGMTLGPNPCLQKVPS